MVRPMKNAEPSSAEREGQTVLRCGTADVLTLFRADAPTDTVLYCLMAGTEAAAVWDALPQHNVHLVAVGGADWNCDFSPWSAPRVFADGADFSGGGAAYLHRFSESIVPTAERALGVTADTRGVVGYSLAGLWAVWTLFQSPLFARVASVSGSLWYDDFSTYLQHTPLCRMPERIYFSVGAEEKNTRNRRMCSVEEDTRAAAEWFRWRGVQTRYEQNRGGHFADVPQRMAKAISYLAEK